MKAGIADLPGHRNSKEMFTTTYNFGRLVAAALDLQKRNEEMGMFGEVMSYSQVCSAFKKFTGKKVFEKETPTRSQRS